MKEQRYHVLKLVEIPTFEREEGEPLARETTVEAWIEQADVSGEGTYGYTPHAADLGEAYGPGEFLFWDAEAQYPMINRMKVGASTQYHDVGEGDEL